MPDNALDALMRHTGMDADAAIALAVREYPKLATALDAIIVAYRSALAADEALSAQMDYKGERADGGKAFFEAVHREAETTDALYRALADAALAR